MKEDPGHQVILVLKMVVESGPLDLRLPALPQVKTMTMAARVDKLFAENLNCDCAFITHYTITGANLTGPVFSAGKRRSQPPCKTPSTTAASSAWPDGLDILKKEEL